MRREEEESGHENSERWLLTYSDMITLLMIFFIIMYVMSTVNEAKFQALAQSLSAALEGGSGMFEGAGPSMMEGMGSGGYPQTEEQVLSNVQEELHSYLKEEGLDNKVTLKSEERGLVISFQEMILFPGGEATLTPEARKIVAEVGKTVGKLSNYIRVEGHTCDLPITSKAYRSNWELASARALNVVHEFVASGNIEPQRLSATAYGEYRPRYPNDSEKHRAQNRRVDIVILNSKYRGTEPVPHAKAASQVEQENVSNEVPEVETEKATSGQKPESSPQTEAKPGDTTYVP